jgi:tRNA pseudouridine55 synthase
MRRKGRDVDGVLLLDKPRGMTSNAALQIAKRLFDARKAGHTGSLDPLATGLLPICFGEATKVSAFLLDADKEYAVTARLGARTSSGDADGDVLEQRAVPELSAAAVGAALARFVGEIEQIPPMFSAVKLRGQPLYKLARQGVEVDREARRVTIHELRLDALRAAELDLFVRCSKGTYVRTLVEDIGRALGCGAHVAALRRLSAGPFSLDRAHALEQLQELARHGPEAADRCLLPIDSALADWPNVTLSEDAAFFLSRGQAVFVPRVTSRGWVRLSNGRQEFMGVGQVLDDGRVAPRRLLKQSP